MMAINHGKIGQRCMLWDQCNNYQIDFTKPTIVSAIKKLLTQKGVEWNESTYKKAKEIQTRIETGGNNYVAATVFWSTDNNQVGRVIHSNKESLNIMMNKE